MGDSLMRIERCSESIKVATLAVSTPWLDREKRKNPPSNQGLWPGAVGRNCADRPAGPAITGAGLGPSSTPAGIPSNGSDGEGCWGEEAAGTHSDFGVGVVRVVAVPEGGAAVVGSLIQESAQQLNDPLSGTVALQRAIDSNNIKAPEVPSLNSPTGKGKKQPKG